MSARSIAEFWGLLERGELPVPYGSALATDLFAAYRTYCIGVSGPALSITDFIPWVLAHAAGVRRIEPRIPMPLVGQDPNAAGPRKPRKRLRVMLVNHRYQVNQERDRGFMLTAIRKFRRDLDAWQRDVQNAAAVAARLSGGEAGDDALGQKRGSRRGSSS